jgi:hypothetical protein
MARFLQAFSWLQLEAFNLALKFDSSCYTKADDLPGTLDEITEKAEQEEEGEPAESDNESVDSSEDYDIGNNKYFLPP